MIKAEPRDDIAPLPSQGARRIAIDPRSLWPAVAIAATIAVVWVVVARAFDVFVLLFIAIVFAEGLRPLVDWLCARRLPRPLAVLVLYAVIAAVLGFLGWLLVRPVVTQVTALIGSLPTYVAQLQALASQANEVVGRNPQAARMLETLANQAATTVQSLAFRLLGAPMLIAGLLFKVVEIYLLTFFWLTTAGLKPGLIELLPVAARRAAADAVAEMSRRLGGTLRGTMINMAIVTALSGAGLAILSAPYPILLALTAGLAELIPILGPWIGGVPAVLVTLANNGLLRAGEVVLLYFAIHLIEGNTLVPYVMHRATELSPLAVVVAVLIGSALLGPVGAVLAVPAAVVTQILLTRIVVPAVRALAARGAPR